MTGVRDGRRRRPSPRCSARGAACLAVLVVAALPLSAVAADEVDDPCRGWTARTLASGRGVLENVEPDGRGGLLLSTERDAVERLTPDGAITTLADGVDRPGGLRVRGDSLFVNTGNGLQSGILGTPDGTLTRIDLDTGERVRIATGLVMPNGLVFGPDGEAYVSRDLGGGAITRIPAADPADGPRPPEQPAGAPERWAELPDTNGLAVSGDGRHLYAVETFTLASNVYRVDLDDPTRIETVGSLFLVGGSPVPKGLDDLDIGPDDVLYITANPAGEVIRFDPATGDACVIASGLTLPSAASFGRGPGWPEDHLYVVGFGGDVVELAPPTAGATPDPDPSPPQDPPRSPDAPSATGTPGTATAGPPAARGSTGEAEAANPARGPLPVTGGGAALALSALVAATLLQRGRRRR